MIQEIAPHQYDNTYRPQKPEAEDYVLYYDGRAVLVTEGEIAFPKVAEICKASETAREKLIYLFTIDEKVYYLLNHKTTDKMEVVDDVNTSVSVERLQVAGYVWKAVEYFRSAKPKYQAFAAITGWQLQRWYDTRRFCGYCGTRMKADGKERMLKCPKCGLMEFPKICPAVIIGVTHGDRILMSKYTGRIYKNYALLAGFNEIGESIEETVSREVMEEVGLKVKNIRYYKSQPWSFSDTLLMGFFCDLDGEEEINLDREELAMAEWFDREKMPVEREDLSLTNDMMMAFKEGRV